MTVFTEDDPREVRPHAMPAWKIVVGRSAPLRTASSGGTEEGWAFLIPPGMQNSVAALGSYIALFIDSGRAIAEREDRVIKVGQRRRRLLLDELDAARHGAALTLPVALEDVLTHDCRPISRALRELTPTTTVDDMASALGVSNQQVRRLIREQTGSTFRELLRWNRLCAAVARLPESSIALAAVESGFSDQAHLTRTSASMFGRTPGSL